MEMICDSNYDHGPAAMSESLDNPWALIAIQTTTTTTTYRFFEGVQALVTLDFGGIN